jgi:hypothetical protein
MEKKVMKMEKNLVKMEKVEKIEKILAHDFGAIIVTIPLHLHNCMNGSEPMENDRRTFSAMSFQNFIIL